ncbi:MAG: hypothetical protein Q9224_001701 [Gallowayella concinna]
MAERRHRRSSASSTSQTHQHRLSPSTNSDIFSDEYALDSLHPSDGFRPPVSILDTEQHTPTRDAQNPAHPEAPLQHDLDDTSPPPRKDYGSRRRSMNEQHPPMTLPHDGSRQFPTHHGPATVLSDDTDPSTSRASISTIARTQSPYQGATGPSQPYGMYPQDIAFSRTPSMATISTVRPRERSYAGPSGPTQPYSMYPQNTVPEDEIGPVSSLDPPMPIGFPGRPQDYRRRLGPDAEDADDLVGPDGYTEQLPPYTRYPDDIPPKQGAPGPASILSAEHGGSGTSEETIMNPFRSRESLPQPASPQAPAQLIAQNHSSTDVTAVASTASSQQDRGGNFKERVKEQGKRRLCCGKVPFWVVAVVTLLMIAVLAGTIGGVVGNARGEQHAAPTPAPRYPHPQTPAAQSIVLTTVTTTSLVDATPLATTPTNLPSLPTGSFFVPLRNLSISHNTCLQSYPMSWNCADEQDLKLDLSVSGEISVSPRFPAQTDRVRYGPQLPQLDQPIPLKLMGDKEGMDKGPAWWFQQPYTKVVVVRSGEFNADGALNDKRWIVDRQARRERRRAVAPATSKPWFCYWNNTLLEGFIYVTQEFSGQYQPVSSEDLASSSSAAESGTSEKDYGSGSFHAYTPLPSSSRRSVEKRQTISPSQLAAYSKDIKIEERRAPNTLPAPYCVHMQIMNDGTASPIPDENGNPQTIQLIETPSTYDGSVETHNIQKRGAFWERDPSDNKCECEWLSS